MFIHTSSYFINHIELRMTIHAWIQESTFASSIRGEAFFLHYITPTFLLNQEHSLWASPSFISFRWFNYEHSLWTSLLHSLSQGLSGVLLRAYLPLLYTKNPSFVCISFLICTHPGQVYLKPWVVSMGFTHTYHHSSLSFSFLSKISSQVVGKLWKAQRSGGFNVSSSEVYLVMRRVVVVVV